VLLKTQRIRRVIAFYTGANAEYVQQLLSGEIDVELTLPGMLAEKFSKKLRPFGSADGLAKLTPPASDDSAICALQPRR
jgi:hypothetical protein